MNYYLDTEFNEGLLPQRILGMKIPTWLSKPKHTIDLISIGIVSEDGREYYAISKEFDLRAAYYKSDGVDEKTGKKTYWLRDNVLKPMYLDIAKNEWDHYKYLSGYNGWGNFTYLELTTMVKYRGKTKKRIAQEIMAFVNPESGEGTLNNKSWNLHLNKFNVVAVENQPVAFYAYFGDYDWISFCSLFGKMINLPKGFPMYCRDLKQTLDEFALSTTGQMLSCIGEPAMGIFNDINKVPLELALKKIKKGSDYPKQQNEHNVLDDAKWNKKLHEFLLKVNK